MCSLITASHMSYDNNRPRMHSPHLHQHHPESVGDKRRRRRSIGNGGFKDPTRLQWSPLPVICSNKLLHSPWRPFFAEILRVPCQGSVQRTPESIDRPVPLWCIDRTSLFIDGFRWRGDPVSRRLLCNVPILARQMLLPCLSTGSGAFPICLHTFRGMRRLYLYPLLTTTTTTTISTRTRALHQGKSPPSSCAYVLCPLVVVVDCLWRSIAPPSVHHWLSATEARQT